MKHLFLFNPWAGSGEKQAAMRAQVDRVFSGLSYTAVTTTHAGHAARVAEEYAASGEEVRIYACGGDGTLNEVVQGAAGHPNAAVTHVPMGTGNDFLRIFGKQSIPRFTDLAALKDGPQAQMDLIDCNGLLGLNVVCAGVDARVAADVDKYKSVAGGTGAYVLSLIVNICKGISRPMTVETEGIRLEGGCSILCVCNGRYYGGGFMPVGEAMPDDGILDMLYIPKISRFTFSRLIGVYSTGHYRDLPGGVLRDFHGTSVVLSAQEPITAVVDGEVVRAPRLEIRLSEKKVNFFFPQGVDYQPLPEFRPYVRRRSSRPG